MPRFAVRCVAAWSIVFVAAASLEAQSVFRLGVEFQVSTYTVNPQGLSPVVARSGGGNFVVAFTQTVSGSTEIAARRFSGTGAPLEAEFGVNTYSGGPHLPAIAADLAGNFVVTWTSNHQDGNYTGIFGQRFDSSGSRRGAEFQVNSHTLSGQNAPSVASENDGDFVVVFQSFFEDGDEVGVFGRRFSSSGVASGANFQVNLSTAGNQLFPEVDVDSDGDFVAVWSDAASGQIFARRFNSAGVGGAETAVSSFTGDMRPSVGVDDDGEFVVTWMRAMGDGGGAGIVARRFNALGGPLGPDFQVNTYTPADQGYPDVAVDGDGDFVVTWESQSQDGSSVGIFAQAFDASGARLGTEFQVNTYTGDPQRLPRAATDEKGGFVVVWEDYGQDGSGSGVFGQLYARLVALDVDGNGSFEPLTDGLLILRFGFGFSGATLINGVVGAGCTRCDAPSITAYLQSMS